MINYCRKEQRESKIKPCKKCDHKNWINLESQIKKLTAKLYANGIVIIFVYAFFFSFDSIVS